MNPVRCLFFRNAALRHFAQSTPSVRRPFENRRILDVGCGGGILTEALGRLGGDVLGIDVVPQNIASAQHHLQSDPSLTQTVRYECMAAEDLVQRDLRFDVVVASEVIEHVKDPVAFIRTLSQLMHPDGLLCMTTLNRTLTSLVGAIWMAEYVLNMVPQGTHNWATFLTPGEMAIAARQAGLKLDVLTGMQLNPITQKWKLSDDTSINYAAAFVKKQSNSTEVPAEPESKNTVHPSEEADKTET